MTHSDVIQMLHAFPGFQPDPRWKRVAKRRLLLAYDEWYRRERAATLGDLPVDRGDASEVAANAIVARGQSWRPVTVAPERAVEAVQAIRPALVMVDGQLPGSRQLIERLTGRDHDGDRTRTAEPRRLAPPSTITGRILALSRG